MALALLLLAGCASCDFDCMGAGFVCCGPYGFP
jgi:hypothetical protein